MSETDTLAPPVLHPATTVGAVHLRVTDLDLARKFYTRMLGLTAAESAGGELTLTADGATPLLVLRREADAPPRDPRTTGLYHFALLLPSRAELGRVLQNLARTRYQLDGLVDHQISEAIYLTDPEGNGIELAADAPAETWRAAMRRWDAGGGGMNRPLDVAGLFAAADERRDPWTGIAPATRMGHVHLHVRDLDEAVAFYGGVLGFETMGRVPGAAFVSAGGYHHHLGLNTWAGARPPRPNAVGLRHFTIRLPSREERERVVGRLQAAGARVAADGEGIFASDPTGNRFSLEIP